MHLHIEEHGSGAPILCIHGAGGSAIGWSDAIPALARLGRVIAYDRRGCARSERPEPYERTSVAEHADDAAGLLEALADEPAVVVGRSYGATVAVDLALRHPELVRALVLLEGDVPPELAPAAARWIERLRDRLERVPVEDVGRTLIEAVAGDGAWPQMPDGLRAILAGNGPAILAELRGEWWMRADEAALATIEQPALVVAAAGSPPEFREPSEVLAALLPNARLATVAGGHLIDPAAPEVLEFVAALPA